MIGVQGDVLVRYVCHPGFDLFFSLLAFHPDEAADLEVFKLFRDQMSRNLCDQLRFFLTRCISRGQAIPGGLDRISCRRMPYCAATEAGDRMPQAG
jgi:hypothetical protein